MEVGYYDTYLPPSGSFDGAWGAWPFFSSGKVIVSDITSGLYVVYFEGAADSDALDPNPPLNFQAYSDFSNPNSMHLTWEDRTSLFGGDPLTPGEFSIEVEKGGTHIASVNGGMETFTDNGLTDGQLYEYLIYANISATDSSSRPVKTSWIAGGSLIPKAPSDFFVTQSGSDLVMHWANPEKNIDGTPMDDFSGVNLYEDGNFRLTFNRTSSDTGKNDLSMFTPSPGTHSYFITSIDNENPQNESVPSNSGYSPIALPFSDNFSNTSLPDPALWINTGTEVTSAGIEPPTALNVLQLDGHPNGGDVLEILPVNLSNAAGAGIMMLYGYQPQGIGNAPEAGDSLILEFLNDQGEWKHIRGYPGTNVVPFSNEVISIDAENPGNGASFFHPVFQFRFRNLGTSSSVERFDLWLVDDVFLGSEFVSVEDTNPDLPSNYALDENYPNPFNPTTKIAYQLPRQGNVRIEIYNMLGQKVRMLLSEHKEPGVYHAIWDGRNDSGAQVSSGIYLYRMVAGDYVKVRKMILMK